MANRCYFTGRWTQKWNNRSHSNRATKRNFKVNLIKKWIKLPDGSKVMIKVNSRDYKAIRGFM